MKQAKPVLVAAHVTRIYGPVQALVNYLKEQKADFAFVSLPFAYSGIENATLERHEKGKKAEVLTGHPAKGWDPVLWIKDFIFTLRMGLQLGKGSHGLYIGVDNLNALAGIVLRWLGVVDKVAYYVIDYTPTRFANPLLNGIYHWVDRTAVAKADVVWNLSVRMQDIRREQGLDEKRNQLVPVGVELDKVKHASKSKVKRKRILYMGALHENKGIQLLIEAMPEIRRRVPGAELHIVGFGPFEDEVKRLARESPARAAIKVPGGMEHEALFKKVSFYGVAMAPYVGEKDSYTYWCDPSKPKEYLACGLPIIITKVPWLWERVADRRKPLGLAIDYKHDELVEACVRLLGDSKFYWACRKNALAFAAGLNWKKIYDRAFKQVP